MINLTEFKPLSPHSVNRLLMATVAVPAGDPQDIESQLEEMILTNI